MPVTYRIDPARRRILTRCDGETTLPEVLVHFAELENDPRCPAGADVLLDLSRMTNLPNVGQIQSAAERAGVAARKVRFGAIAIVVDSGDTFGMARAFGTFAEAHFTRSGVFPTRAAAEAWLDAPETSPGPTAGKRRRKG
jgi:hypothetical protein